MTCTALFAQDPAPAGKPPDGGMFSSLPLLMIGVMGLFYVVMILPAQRRQKREAAKLLESIKPGMKVATISGIIGTVVSLKEGSDEVTIRSEDSKLRVLRSTITRVLGEDAEVKA